MVFNKNKLLNPGVGLGLRKDLYQVTLEHLTKPDRVIDWLEIVPENHINRGGIDRKRFETMIKTGIQLIPHGVNLSIGSAPRPGELYSYDRFLLDQLKELFSEIKPPWFSDHLSCTRIEDIYLQELIPMPLIEESVEIITNNIKFLQDFFQLDFLVENPSYYSTIIPPQMTEWDFINSICKKADCGLLLDVNNVYVNSTNHGKYEPLEFINQLDLERVTQVHIAGHLENYESWLSEASVAILDTHGEKIKEEVYAILEYLLEKTNVNAILLERDSNFPEFTGLLEELKTIKQIYERQSSIVL